MEQEGRLNRLFDGLARAYGVVVPTGKQDARGKVGAKYNTRRQRLDEEAWRAHLAGEHGLVPIPIRDDDKAGFGAIDVDTYPLDLPELTARVEKLGLPLVVCRSKSGGAHLFLFLREPHDAAKVQDCLMNWADALGYPGVEIFPKQTHLSSERDTGNGIAAPYRNAKNTLEYAVDPETLQAMTLEAFLTLAEARRVRGDELKAVDVQVPEDLDNAPPCLQHWARVGVGEGQRNDVMFDFAVFAKRRWPDGWREKFEQFNHRYSRPPLSSEETLAIIKSVSKDKEYLYKSKCEGPYCNPQLCRKRDHGRGGGYDSSNVLISDMLIVHTDPPTYILSVNGHRIELTGDEFRDQNKFRAKVEDTLFQAYMPLKKSKWHALRDKLYNEADHEDAPPDAGPRGQLNQMLDDFFSQQSSTERAKLNNGYCFLDVENGRGYFKSADLMAFLKKNRLYGVPPKEMFNLVRSLGGGNTTFRVDKNSVVHAWWVPRDRPPEPEPLPVPDMGDSGKTEAPF